MSDKLGPVVYGSGHTDDEIFLGRDFNNSRDYSEETAKLIDSEIHAIISEACELCKKVLTENRAKLDFIANYLTAHETMDEDQFELSMKGEPTEDDLIAIAQKKKKDSEIENEKRAKEAEEAEKTAAEQAKRLSELVGEPKKEDSSDKTESE